MALPIKKPRASRAPDLSKTERIDNLLRKMQMGLGYDPLVELISLARKQSTTTGEKIKIAQDLMSYVYPKIKAVSNDTTSGEVINITVEYQDTDSARKMQEILPEPLTKEEIAVRQGKDILELESKDTSKDNTKEDIFVF